jgi:hypothetical protein
MKIGFTGTREGMSREQQKAVKRLLKKIENLYDITELHHGDCIGADTDMHDIMVCSGRDVKIKIHPPINEKQRAFCKGDAYFKKKEFLERDRYIVEKADAMIATPNQRNEIKRGSGTWYTIRQAKKQKVKLYIIYPEGDIEEF